MSIPQRQRVPSTRCMRACCLPRNAARSYLPAMAMTHDFFEWEALPSVLDATDNDPLLQRLRAGHGEPRFDIAPELIATARRAASRPASSNT